MAKFDEEQVKELEGIVKRCIGPECQAIRTDLKEEIEKAKPDLSEIVSKIDAGTAMRNELAEWQGGTRHIGLDTLLGEHADTCTTCGQVKQKLIDKGKQALKDAGWQEPKVEEPKPEPKAPTKFALDYPPQSKAYLEHYGLTEVEQDEGYTYHAKDKESAQLAIDDRVLRQDCELVEVCDETGCHWICKKE